MSETIVHYDTTPVGDVLFEKPGRQKDDGVLIIRVNIGDLLKAVGDNSIMSVHPSQRESGSGGFISKVKALPIRG